jgi:hypothetical protein
VRIDAVESFGIDNHAIDALGHALNVPAKHEPAQPLAWKVGRKPVLCVTLMCPQ